MHTLIDINQCSVEFSCDIYTNCRIQVVLFQYQPVSGDLQTVTVDAHSEIVPIRMTCNLPSGITRLSLRVLQATGSTSNITYIDNLTLKIQ